MEMEEIKDEKVTLKNSTLKTIRNLKQENLISQEEQKFPEETDRVKLL